MNLKGCPAGCVTCDGSNACTACEDGFFGSTCEGEKVIFF